MKLTKCKDRLLLWMRKAASLNSDKQKYHSFTPVASDGFILNYINTLLILSKPFVSNFNKYGNFINKINCFYLVNNDHIENAKISMEKIELGAEDEFA
jgi:hypothetical protein